MKKKLNIILINKHRFIAIDPMLPVLMEIKKRFGDSVSITIVLPDETNFNLIKKSYHIMSAIETFNGKILYQPRRSRILLYIWSVYFFLTLINKNNLFFTGGQCLLKHAHFIRLLKKISNTVECGYNLLPPYIPFIQNLKITFNYLAGLNNKQASSDNSSFDLFISSLPFEYLSVQTPCVIPENKYMEIGYTRTLPSWRQFADAQSEQWMKERQQKGQPDDYCLYILGNMSKRVAAFDEPPLSELVKETVQILKRYDIFIIFKPHAITDLDTLRTIMKEAEYDKYTIDYGHPMILTKNAKFLIGNVFSCTMIEACLLDVPVIEYAHYDKEIFRLLKGRSYGVDCCDVFIQHNPETLRNTIADIMRGKFKKKDKTEVKQAICSSKFENLMTYIENFYS